MKFKVVKTKTYTLEDRELRAFKEKMLEYYMNEEEVDSIPYTIDDIADDFVRDALADTVQNAFSDLGEFDVFYSGIQFDDFNNTITFNFDEDDISDCVYEAVAVWRDLMEE